MVYSVNCGAMEATTHFTHTHTHTAAVMQLIHRRLVGPMHVKSDFHQTCQPYTCVNPCSHLFTNCRLCDGILFAFVIFNYLNIVAFYEC